MFDVDNIDLNDKEMYDMLCQKKSLGIFQLDSHLAKSTLGKIQPKNIRDLSLVLAVIRPGALQQLDTLLAVRNGEEEAEYLDPRLKSILNETHSIILYQEQHLRIAQEIAGFSEVDADKYRKIISKKLPDEMKKIRPKFINGCVKNGMSKDNAEELMNILSESASYSFNASHSFCYSKLSAYEAFLKCHYTTVFFLAKLITSKNVPDQQEQYKKLFYDMLDFGITLLPPSLEHMNEDFKIIDDNTIRFGLKGVKSFGDSAVKQLRKLKKCTKWPDLLHEFLKNKIRKTTVEGLIKCGAIDYVGWERNQMLRDYELASSLSESHKLLFLSRYPSDSSSISAIIQDIPNRHSRLRIGKDTAPLLESYTKKIAPTHLLQKDYWETFYLGIPLTSNRVTEYNSLIEYGITHDLAMVGMTRNERVCTVGLLESVKRIKTKKKNEDMAFLTISDHTALCSSVVVFPNLYTKCFFQNGILKAEGDEILKITGRVDGKSLIAEAIEILN